MYKVNINDRRTTFCPGADSRGAGLDALAPSGTKIFAFLPVMGVRFFLTISCFCPPPPESPVSAPDSASHEIEIDILVAGTTYVPPGSTGAHRGAGGGAI